MNGWIANKASPQCTIRRSQHAQRSGTRYRKVRSSSGQKHPLVTNNKAQEKSKKREKKKLITSWQTTWTRRSYENVRERDAHKRHNFSNNYEESGVHYAVKKKNGHGNADCTKKKYRERIQCSKNKTENKKLKQKDILTHSWRYSTLSHRLTFPWYSYDVVLTRWEHDNTAQHTQLLHSPS